MLILCPDTMVLVSIVNKERGWAVCKKHMAKANETILLQCNLIEVPKVCAREYLEVARALYDDSFRNKLLRKYEKDSVISQLISKNEYVNQLDVVEGLLYTLPSDILKLILQYNMKIFPNPFLSNCSTLRNPEVVKAELKDFIRETLSLPIRAKVKARLGDYIQKYGLEKRIQEARRLLSPKLWHDLKNDRHVLATYLKAREIWSSLQLLTSEFAFDSASKERPDKFSVFYFRR